MTIHVKNIYDEMKCRYIQKYGKTGWFYKDYFENEETGLPNFTESLFDNEPQINHSRAATESQIDTLWENIEQGIYTSARIEREVDGLTDKYYGDNSF